MDSEHQPLPNNHQEKRGVVVPICKKAVAGADERSRRVLGDIGNVMEALRVTEGGFVQNHAAQPVPRPQAADAGKPVAGAIEGEAAKGRAKAAKLKVTFKPDPETIIVISPSTNEKTNQNSAITISSGSKSKSSRRKIHTFSSVLIARSKVACEKKDMVSDIDASDIGDQLAVVDYVEDLHKFYKLAEISSRPHDYMPWQLEINGKMRAILVDWLIEVHHRFDLMPETLYLTVYIVDRYLSMEPVLRKELQLVGVCAMLIACKYEEIWAPVVNDFMCISDMQYTREQILAQEKRILSKLEWNLTVPTLYVFLVRFAKAALCDKEVEQMVFFFAELALLQYSFVTYRPSMVAAAVVYVARCTLKKTPIWTETLQHHTGFSEPELLNCARILVKQHSERMTSKLKSVFKKYSRPDLGAVALYPPATELP